LITESSSDFAFVKLVKKRALIKLLSIIEGIDSDTSEVDKKILKFSKASLIAGKSGLYSKLIKESEESFAVLAKTGYNTNAMSLINYLTIFHSLKTKKNDAH